MATQQRIVIKRRQYNQWVASQTLEDFALRFTATQARRSSFRVGNTAMGPVSFLAMEAIGGAITLAYGFDNALWAIGVFAVLMFLIGLPIAYYAANYGVDIDLLTRGAGFGYLGSTITSLIYASFTFLLFAIEASILSAALELVLHIPDWLAHLISATIVIPIAIHGIRLISGLQLVTQPVWLLLQFAPIAYVAWSSPADLSAWGAFASQRSGPGAGNHLLQVGMACSVLLSLLPQIGEQVDYLRFLPVRTRANRAGWWTALLLSGPGWIVMGTLKLLAGSFLAVFALRHAVPLAQADQPTQMYYTAFLAALQSPTAALAMTGVFVIVCQIKINVTNAYAGSIAWSNFFSRLTHSHPGRVVWLVFNVVLALLLMETGIFRAIEAILLIYANFAAGWLGALTADLVINKPLGLSPAQIEFKRAHLYDINPVGVGALLLSIIASSATFFGAFGEAAQPLSPMVGLLVGFAAAPAIAAFTHGRYYLARSPAGLPEGAAQVRCSICENHFERSDMAHCHAYGAPICSLCCTLETRCRDQCKQGSRASEQLASMLWALLPRRFATALNTRAGHFAGILLLFNLITGLLVLLVFHQFRSAGPAERAGIGDALWLVYLCLTVLLGVSAWIIVLAHESRRAAEAESARQTAMLIEEIAAHQRTDAALEKAKELAETANAAKTRFLVGISHEVRTPLNSIYGYAQLLERKALESTDHAVRVIRSSSEHLVHLIDGLLDISNIEIGLVRLNRDLVPLAEFLDQLVEMFRPQAAARGIAFTYERAPRLPAFVRTDQKRLRQILINLLSNAIKYTRSGQAGLAVRCQGEVVEFEIFDTGVGIAADELERIFEPFERGRDAAVRSVPGTGLGLTITKLLVHVMGGELLVRSEPGVGTTFNVRLYLSKATLSREEELARRQALGYAGPRRTVLVIDDDAGHLALIQDLLQPLGFCVVTADSGRLGMESAARHAPDLVLLDLSLPDADGWSLARELHALGTPTRVLIVSANAHEEQHAAGEGLHDGFIRKPVDTQALLDCVGRVLALQWVYEPSPAATAVGAEAAASSDLASSIGASLESALDSALDSALASSPLASSALAPTLASAASSAPPGQHHIDDLYHLGRIGHVRGVEAKLRQMEADDPASAPLASTLRGLVERFDLRQYLQVLDSVRRGGRGHAAP
jgi:signal transduction histidine kinase/CheY-like chemotaxis protein